MKFNYLLIFAFMLNLMSCSDKEFDAEPPTVDVGDGSDEDPDDEDESDDNTGAGYKFKVYMDISNGPEIRRLENKDLWNIVAENCDGPWLLTWELRKGGYYIDETYGMERKQKLGKAFKNKDGIVELPYHWSWYSQPIPHHEQVCLDCGWNVKGTVIYYEEKNLTSVILPDGVEMPDPNKSDIKLPTVSTLKGIHNDHEVYMLAREWITNQPPTKEFDKSLSVLDGVCFEFQVPYKDCKPPKNFWTGIKYALDNNKKVFLLMPAPNNTAYFETYSYLEGVKILFNDVKTNVGEEALYNENLYFIPNSYDWDKKYYRNVPETTPDGQIANTATGAALWLLCQRDPGLYIEPEVKKGALPEEWKVATIGQSRYETSVYKNNDIYVLSGGGYDGSAPQQKDVEPFNGTTKDKCVFMYKEVSNDFEIVAKVLLPPHTDRWGRCGIMLRSGLAEDDIFASVTLAAGHGKNFQYRDIKGGKSVKVNPLDYDNGPMWVKMIRKGNEIEAFYSFEENTPASWISLGKKTFSSLPSNLFVGLTSTNHSADIPYQAQQRFQDIYQKLNYPGYITNLTIK